MPQSGNDSSLFGAWPGGLLIALLVGLGAVGWVQTPFKPERPNEPPGGLRSVGVQDVDARLWQDPFAALVEAQKVREQSKGPRPECRSVEIDAKGKTLLMRSDCPEEEGGASATTAQADRHGLDNLRRQIRSQVATLSQEWAGVPDARPVTVLGSWSPPGPPRGPQRAAGATAMRPCPP